MNTKTTWRLLIAAVLLFGFIWLLERRPAITPPAPTSGKRLLTGYIPEQTRSISILRTNGLIRAERAGERWRMTTPPYPAQSTAIETLLESLSNLRAQDSISPQEIQADPRGLASFGLSPPAFEIAVQSDTGRQQFRVGRRTPVGDQVYVQLIGSAGIDITDAAFLEKVPLSSDAWRDPMLLHLGRTPLNRLEVQSGARGFELQLDPTNQVWRLTKPMAARADARNVEFLIQQLRLARVTGFVTDDPRADLDQFGLLTPEVELTLSQDTNRLASIQFGKAPTNDASQVFARLLNYTNIVLVNKEIVEMLRLPHTAFRDRILLTFSPGAVDRLDVRAEEEFALQRVSGNAWNILGPASIPADTLLVQEFLTNLTQLEIVEFPKDVVTDFSVYGLDPAARSYLLKSTITNANTTTNIVLAQLDFSTNVVDKVFARRSDETSVYAIAPADVARLPKAAFELRDRRLWNFAASNVTAITISQKGQTVKLMRDPMRGWSGDEIANAALEETLLRLGQLQAVSWVGRGDEIYKLLGFPEVAYRITLELKLETKPQTIEIDFGRLSPRGNPYAAVILPGESQRLIFQFPARLYADIVRDLSAAPRTAGR